MFFKRGDRDEARVRRLRERAARLRERGRLDRAVECYRELEELEPNEPDWSRRAADCYRRLGLLAQAVSALERAATAYVAGGFTLKAIAICKVLLAIDPQHAGAQEQLAELAGQRSVGLDRLLHRAQVPTRARSTPRASSSPPAAPTEEGQVAPARPSAPPVPSSLPDDVDSFPKGAADFDGPGSAVPESLPEAREPQPTELEPDVTPPLSIEADSLEAPDVGSQPPSHRSIPPGAPLEAVALNAVTKSRESAALSQRGAPVYELDLDDPDWLEASDAFTPETNHTVEQVRETARELLPHTPLFSDVSETSFRHLIEQVDLKQVEAGEVIVREGDPPDALYVIVEGQVEVVAEGPPRTRWGELGEGEFFGEIGIISDAPRQRTVAALESTQLLVLDRTMVSELVDREPAFLQVLLRFLRERLVARLMRTSELFAPFGERERQELVERFRFLELDAGTVLIREGDQAEGLFVLLSGEAEVVRGDSAELLATLVAGDVFGEMSLLAQDVAMGTVRVTRKSFALLMPRRSFTETVMAQPHVLLFTSELAERRRAANIGPQSGAEARVELV